MAQLNGTRKFKVQIFVPIIDTLNMLLKQRLREFKQEHKSSIWFFSRLSTLNSEKAKQICKEYIYIMKTVVRKS